MQVNDTVRIKDTLPKFAGKKGRIFDIRGYRYEVALRNIHRHIVVSEKSIEPIKELSPTQEAKEWAKENWKVRIRDPYDLVEAIVFADTIYRRDNLMDSLTIAVRDGGFLNMRGYCDKMEGLLTTGWKPYSFDFEIYDRSLNPHERQRVDSGAIVFVNYSYNKSSGSHWEAWKRTVLKPK